jgi:DNA mismatch repair protein MutL
VTVRDLFARLPARLKFLRSEATELRHSIGALTALAFVRPEVGFAAEHGRRAILQLPPVREPAQRLPDLVGAARARQARPVRHALGTVTITGFLLPPSGSREMVVAVNGRVVRDRLLAGAVNRALKGPGGASEAEAYLHIQLPAGEVDVNVHPAKAEVRFADPGRVMSAVTQALAASRIALHGPVEVRRVVSVSTASSAGPQLPLGAPAPMPAGSFERARVQEARPPTSASAAPPAAAPTPWGRYIGQYRATYLVLEDGDGLVLIDQHVAHERVLFEALLADKARPAVQRLLLPEVVELPPALAAIAREAAPELEALGLELEQASGASVRVLGVPSTLPAHRAGAMVRRLLADLADSAVPGEGLRERAAASLSCQAAIKKNWTLSAAEAQALLADLAGVNDPHRCPHGRPIVLRLPHDEIERRIGRR